jgi:hypothetical protein
MLTDEAFCTSQDSMAASPGPIEVGLTVNVTTTGFEFAPPPVSMVIQPAAASKSIITTKITFFIKAPS